MLFKIWEYFKGKSVDEEIKAANIIQKYSRQYIENKLKIKNDLNTSIKKHFDNFDCIVFDDIGNPNRFCIDLKDSELDDFSVSDDFVYYLEERKRIKNLSKKAREYYSTNTRSTK